MTVCFTFVPEAEGDASGASFFFDPKHVRSIVTSAEAAGFDNILIDDDSGLLGNLDLAAFAGGNTHSISSVVTHWPGVMSPVVAASQFATLARKSDGRVSLRILAEPVGSDDDHLTTLKRTDEYLMLLKRLWKNGLPFDYEGPFHSIRAGVIDNPAPASWLPTIRMSGLSGSALQVSGRHADIFELTPGLLSDIRQTIHRVTAAADAFGRAGKIRFSLPVSVRATGSEPSSPVADPARSALTLLSHVEAGITEFVVSGLNTTKDIARFGETIIPLVRNSARHLSQPAGSSEPDAVPARWAQRQAAILRWRGVG